MADAVPSHRSVQSRFGGLRPPRRPPAARLDELVAQLDDSDSVLVSLIASSGALPAAVDRVIADRRLALASVEVPGALDGRPL